MRTYTPRDTFRDTSVFANLQPLNRVQRVLELCLNKRETRRREGMKKAKRERESCCVFTQTWSVLPLCHSATWAELCGRLRRTVMKHTKQSNFCSHRRSYGERRVDTASVPYHGLPLGDTCILSLSPSRPIGLTVGRARQWPSEEQDLRRVDMKSHR